MSAIKSNAKKKREMQLLDARHELLLEHHKQLKKRIYALIDQLTLHGVSLIQSESLTPYLRLLNTLLLERPEPHFYVFLRGMCTPPRVSPTPPLSQLSPMSPPPPMLQDAYVSPAISLAEMQGAPSPSHHVMQLSNEAPSPPAAGATDFETLQFPPFPLQHATPHDSTLPTSHTHTVCLPVLSDIKL